jgi:hypothetical protein
MGFYKGSIECKIRTELIDYNLYFLDIKWLEITDTYACIHNIQGVMHIKAVRGSLLKDYERRQLNLLFARIESLYKIVLDVQIY